MEITVKGVQCPVCNVGEMDPEDAARQDDRPWWNREQAIRGFKVLVDERRGWESECLHCKEMFGNGWFCEANVPDRLESTRKVHWDTISNRRQALYDVFGTEGPFTAENRAYWVEATKNPSIDGPA